ACVVIYVGYSDATDEPSAATLATVAAGRTAAVTPLRAPAAALEQLPLDAVAEVLVLLEPTPDDLRRQAALPGRASGCGRGRDRDLDPLPREHQLTGSADRYTPVPRGVWPRLRTDRLGRRVAGAKTACSRTVPGPAERRPNPACRV